ncbi:MAG: hypothetical protein EHM80_03680 [Nitrospiraceae bacterium]|nr:MAG: hypothetical protein EHM80_03680 [Nitrospiraceae bacterium]
MPPIENDVADEDWHNDNEVSNAEVLWRVIIKEWVRDHPHIPGHFIASDQAYRQSELSVFVASGTTQQAVLDRWPGASLVQFPAQFIREDLGLVIVRNPRDTDPNPAHRLIGKVDHKRMTSGTAKKIALKAEWVVLNHNPHGG